MARASARFNTGSLGKPELALVAALATIAVGCAGLSVFESNARASLVARHAPSHATVPSIRPAAKAEKVAVPAFIPEEKNRSLESVTALLAATHWAASYAGDSEPNEEALRGRLLFDDGAYVAESKIYKGNYCLYTKASSFAPSASATAAAPDAPAPDSAPADAKAKPKDSAAPLVKGDVCDVDARAIAAGATASSVPSIGGVDRDLATAAQFNAAYAAINDRGGVQGWVGQAPPYGPGPD